LMVRAGLSTSANDAEAVIASSQQRYVFTEEDARKARAPDTELATNLVNGIGLGVERLELAGCSPKEEQDTRISRGPLGCGTRIWQVKKLRKSQASDSQRADAEQIAA